MFGATFEIGTNALAAIPLLFAGIASVVSAVAAVIAANRTRELKPNGGNSMHDKVEKTYRTIAATDRADDKSEPTVTIDKKAT